MPRNSIRMRTAVLLVATLVLGGSVWVQGQAASGPIRGILIGIGQARPEMMAAWKARGGNAVVVVLDEAIPRGRWSELSTDAERAGLALYAWIEVARNPALADAHPTWMASPGGHHDDWRRRFPGAPIAKPDEVIKAWPWVPIDYVPAFAAHRRRIHDLLDSLPGRWAGVLLNDLQAGPSSCGCGNDQCRWALDYGSRPTAEKSPGDDVAARLVAELATKYPGKAVIPVWVTECERVDLPGVPGSTGRCGRVECAKTSCWPRYSRCWNPLLRASPGPLGIALWTGPFGRDPAWIEQALALFEQPPGGGAAIPPDRALAVLQGWDTPEPDRAKLVAKSRRAGGGFVIALTAIEQSWEPRLVKLPGP
jgi:hypothetical protein